MNDVSFSGVCQQFIGATLVIVDEFLVETKFQVQISWTSVLALFLLMFFVWKSDHYMIT